MAKQLTDDELNLRRKSRRRLVGAVALTLAVVVVLPMVLDSEPRPGVQDIDLRIPDPDKAGEFVPGVVVSEVAEALPAAPAPASAAMDAPVAAAPAVSDMEAAPDGKQPDSGSANKPVAAGTYVAQVGAYANPDTAKQELNKLKGWGFKVYTEKAGDKIRVRVGPYTDREKMEKVRRMLESHGLHPDIITVK
jgi:DedD protein